MITTSPPESAHSVGRALQRRGRPLGRGRPRRVDLRAAPARVPHRRAAPPRRAARTLTARRRGRRRLRLRARGADMRKRASRTRPGPQRRRPRAPRGGSTRRQSQTSSTLSASRSSTPAASAPPAATRAADGGARQLAAYQPDEAARLELVVAGPLTDEEQRASAATSLPRASTWSARSSVSGRWRCSERPTLCS